MPEEFWAVNPLILFHPKYLHRFFPSDRLHTAARMNAVMRCSLYISILISTIRKEPIWLLIPIITAGVTASWMYHEDPKIFNSTKTKDNETDLERYRSVDDKNEDTDEITISSNSKNIMDTDLKILATEIITKEIHKYPKKDLRRKNQKHHVGQYSPDPRLFQDMDTSIQQMQRDRAIVTSSVSGGIPDTTKFSRNMMKMDKYKTKTRR